MSTDGPAVDVGLLSPVTVGFDSSVTDGAVLDALITAEVALVRARGARRTGPADVVIASRRTFGWTGAGEPRRAHAIDASARLAASVAGGNPVIPLVGLLNDAVGAGAAGMHRGATSQDIVDSALMFVAARAAREVSASLNETAVALRGSPARTATTGRRRAHPHPARRAHHGRAARRRTGCAGCSGRPCEWMPPPTPCPHSSAEPGARSPHSSSCSGRMPRPNCPPRSRPS